MIHWCSSTREFYQFSMSPVFKEKASMDLWGQHPDFWRYLRPSVWNKPKQASSWGPAKPRLVRNVLNVSFLKWGAMKGVAVLPRKSVPALVMPSSPTSHPKREVGCSSKPHQPEQVNFSQALLCFWGVWNMQRGQAWVTTELLQRSLLLACGHRGSQTTQGHFPPAQPLPGEQLQMFFRTFLTFMS